MEVVKIGRGPERRTMAGWEPFLGAAAALLVESGCTVRNWRSSPRSGAAYTRSLDWGIEVPEPRGPISYCTFAHEIGHQMLHRSNSTPRWVEEVEAFEYALATFDRFDLPGRGRAQADASRALVTTARKTLRRAKAPGSMWLRMHGRWPLWALDDLLHAGFGGEL